MKKIVYKDLKIGDELVSRCGEAWEVVAKVDSCCIYPLIARNEINDLTIKLTKEGRTSLGSIYPNDLFIPAKTEYLNLHRFDNGRFAVFGPYDCCSQASFVADSDPNGFIKTIEVEV